MPPPRLVQQSHRTIRRPCDQDVGGGLGEHQRHRDLVRSERPRAGAVQVEDSEPHRTDVQWEGVRRSNAVARGRTCSRATATVPSPAGRGRGPAWPGRTHPGRGPSPTSNGSSPICRLASSELATTASRSPVMKWTAAPVSPSEEEAARQMRCSQAASPESEGSATASAIAARAADHHGLLPSAYGAVEPSCVFTATRFPRKLCARRPPYARLPVRTRLYRVPGWDRVA